MNQKPEIAVLFCANRSYCEPMAVAIASLLFNNPHQSFRIFVVLSDEAAEERALLTATVRRFSNAEICFKAYDCSTLQGFPADQRITLDAYTRLFLDDVLDPDITRVIYLDCDLIVCGDIGELWKEPLGDNLIGAVQDQFSNNLQPLGFSDDEPYYNSGVLLIDVERWKAAGATEAIARYIIQNASILRYHDQDAINAVLRGRIQALHPKWNFSPRHADAGPEICGMSRAEFKAVRSRPAIVHFLGLKPWLNDTHYRDLYFRFHALTSWYSGRERRQPRGRLEGLKAWVKWHLPSLSRALRKWTGFGDPALQVRGKLRSGSHRST